MPIAGYSSCYRALQAERISVVGWKSGERILIHGKYVSRPDSTILSTFSDTKTKRVYSANIVEGINSILCGKPTLKIIKTTTAAYNTAKPLLQ